MKFHKALQKAQKLVQEGGYCCYISRDDAYYVGYEVEVDGLVWRPVTPDDRCPLRKRSFDIEDFLADDWEVEQ